MVNKVMGALFGLGWFCVATRVCSERDISVDTFFMGSAVLIAGFMAGSNNESRVKILTLSQRRKSNGV